MRGSAGHLRRLIPAAALILLAASPPLAEWTVEDPELPVNLVFMGQGEPLDNAAEVLRAIEGFQDPLGPAMSWRRITLSTVGVVPEINRLASMGASRPRLAVSLNATTDEVRSQIMPVNRKWPIAELLASVGSRSRRSRSLQSRHRHRRGLRAAARRCGALGTAWLGEALFLQPLQEIFSLLGDLLYLCRAVGRHLCG